MCSWQVKLNYFSKDVLVQKNGSDNKQLFTTKGKPLPTFPVLGLNFSMMFIDSLIPFLIKFPMYMNYFWGIIEKVSRASEEQAFGRVRQ